MSTQDDIHENEVLEETAEQAAGQEGKEFVQEGSEDAIPVDEGAELDVGLGVGESADDAATVESTDNSSVAESAAQSGEAKEPQPEAEEDPAVVLERIRERADLLFSQRNWKDALEDYHTILKSEPRNVKAINRLARIYAIRGQVKNMVLESLRWQGILADAGQDELSGVVAHSILRIDPYSQEAHMGILRHIQRTSDVKTHIEACRNTARFFIEAGLGEVSIYILRRALELYPTNVEMALDMADTQMASGNIEEAIKDLRDLAHRFDREGDKVRAIDTYRRLKLLVPAEAGICLRLGNLYRSDGKLDDAISEYRNALRIDYENRESMLCLGDALLQQEKFSEAKMAFSKLVAANSMDVEARYRMARAHEGLGEHDDAVREYLTVGRAFMEGREYREAQNVYEHVKVLEPNNGIAVRELSTIADLLAAEKARQEQLKRLQEENEARKKAAQQRAAAPALSEDDLYGDSSAGNLLGDGGLLGGMSDELSDSPLASGLGEAVAEANTTDAEEKLPDSWRDLPRVAETAITQGQLLVPVPFLITSHNDVVSLLRQAVQLPPDPEVIPWNFLPIIKTDRQIAREKKEEEEKINVPNFKQVEAGPVKSAFGTSGGFAAAIRGNAHKKRRKGHWEFVPEATKSVSGGSTLFSSKKNKE